MDRQKVTVFDFLPEGLMCVIKISPVVVFPFISSPRAVLAGTGDEERAGGERMLIVLAVSSVMSYCGISTVS